MKKLKGLLCVSLAILLTCTGCTAHTQYDTILLDTAAKVTTDLEFNDRETNPFLGGNRVFTVDKISDYDFSVDVNGTKMEIQLPDNTDSSPYLPTKVKDVSSNESKKIFSQSQKLIYDYIESSTILTDKTEIKSYISALKLKEAIFTEDIWVGAYFSPEDNTIYINKSNVSHICEWMIVHELVHAISYYTHGCDITKEAYAYDIFNEVLTDMITASLEPQVDSSIQSGYAMYYDLLYPYMNLLGAESIKAYFYGYDTVFKKINPDEFDFFVIVIENYGAQNSDVYYNNLVWKWYATY